MNNLNKYEKIIAQKLRELTLPDEEVAWSDMKRRLDDDNRKRPFIPPLRFGCAFLSLLFAVALIGFIFFAIFPNNKSKPQFTQQENQVTDSIKFSEKLKKIIVNNTENSRRISTPFNKDSLLQNKNTVSQPTLKKDSSKREMNTVMPKSELAVAKQIKNRKTIAISRFYTTNKTPVTKRSKITVKATTITDNLKNDIQTKQLSDSHLEQNDTLVASTDSKTIINNTGTVFPKQKDSTATIRKKIDTVSAAISEKKKKEVQKVSFSAGFAIWQQIDNIGPKPQAILFPNDPNGSVNNKLFDYVPSIYARMYKDSKWFFHSEFRYRAPQYEKNLMFSQRGIASPVGNAIVTKVVTKSYYHQLPVTFNYFISKNWSLGGGAILNKFNRAVTVEQVRAPIPGLPLDTLLSNKFFVITKADSNFVKHYLQGLLESQYRWKKFSFGIRYSAALQPYLIFTLPGNVEQREKSSSLQVFLRYEFWRSKN